LANLGVKAVTARGADSGTDVSANPSADQNAATATLYATKLTIAHATDTPSGPMPGSQTAGQVVAKFVVSNSTNVANLDATLKLMNLAISTSIDNSGTRNIKIYKTSVAPANLLATAAYTGGTDYSDTALADGDFIDVTIGVGGSVTIIVTADTQDATTGKGITVGLAGDDITWSDVITSAITAVDTLPLTGKTLSY